MCRNICGTEEMGSHWPSWIINVAYNTLKTVNCVLGIGGSKWIQALSQQSYIISLYKAFVNTHKVSIVIVPDYHYCYWGERCYLFKYKSCLLVNFRAPHFELLCKFSYCLKYAITCPVLHTLKLSHVQNDVTMSMFLIINFYFHYCFLFVLWSVITLTFIKTICYCDAKNT